MIYFGENTNVFNLVVDGLRAPSSGPTDSDAIMLQGARVEGATIEADRGGTEVAWRSIFGMVEHGSGVSGVTFWPSRGYPSRGRLFYVAEPYCYAKGCRFSISNTYRSAVIHSASTGSSNGTSIFTDPSASYITAGVLVGDWLVIDFGDAAGAAYSISARTATTLTVSPVIPTASGITYSIFRQVEDSEGYIAYINDANFELSDNSFRVVSSLGAINGGVKAWVSSSSLSSHNHVIGNQIIVNAPGNVQLIGLSSASNYNIVSSNSLILSHTASVNILDVDGDHCIVTGNLLRNLTLVGGVTKNVAGTGSQDFHNVIVS